MIRAVVISSCDRLADLACAGTFGPERGLELAGVVRTRMRARTRNRLVRQARSAGALFYVRYMFAEIHLPGLWRGSDRPRALLDRAAAADVPVHTTDAVNGPEAIEFIGSRSADLVLSVRPGAIFRERLIERVPPILNLHGSMLPEFRGIGGVLQALAAGREALGCSVHLVPNEEVDRGPIAAQRVLETVPGRSVYYHTIALYRAAPDTIAEAARATIEGAEPRPNTGGSYFSWPARSTLRRLHERGRRLVEWRDLRARNLG